MTYVECAGGQDRDTTTSETRPYIPPNKTRNCYLNDPNNRSIGFDRSLCGTSSDRACNGNILVDGGEDVPLESAECKADNQGGYCKKNDKYYVARNNKFIELTTSDILERYKSSTNDNVIDIKRALNDQERRYTNRIRQMQIMGKGSSGNDSSGKDSKAGINNDTDVHNSVGNILYNIGLGFIFIIFLISLSVILVQKNII